ncbi:hypothetical protein [Comamonas sp. MYb396]|uniref:hypothetical protein n=1 Tax=Comamonas sp. MYb396 TaxID=2745302 RepID=UPI0030B3E681
MNAKVAGFADAQVDEATLKVEKVWGEILRVTDRLLQAHHHFGFSNIQENVSPTIEDMLKSLRILEVILDALVSGPTDVDCTRILLNAKQAILNIEAVNLALNSKDVDGYELAMNRLNNQAPF